MFAFLIGMVFYWPLTVITIALYGFGHPVLGTIALVLLVGASSGAKLNDNFLD